MTIFETDRLIVRQLQWNDFAPFHEMQSSAAVMQFTTGDPQSEKTNREQLQQCIDGYSSNQNDFLVWAIIQKRDQSLVGTCAVVKNDRDENELGYRFLETYWGRGFGREILGGLVEYCQGPLGMDSLVAYVDQRNVASVKILESSLMTFDCQRPDANGDPELRFWLANDSNE